MAQCARAALPEAVVGEVAAEEQQEADDRGQHVRALRVLDQARHRPSRGGAIVHQITDIHLRQRCARAARQARYVRDGHAVERTEEVGELPDEEGEGGGEERERHRLEEAAASAARQHDEAPPAARVVDDHD